MTGLPFLGALRVPYIICMPLGRSITTARQCEENHSLGNWLQLGYPLAQYVQKSDKSRILLTGIPEEQTFRLLGLLEYWSKLWRENNTEKETFEQISIYWLKARMFSENPL